MGEFLTRLKEPTVTLAAIVTLVIAIGGGFFAGARWYVSSEVEPLRKEVAELIKYIEINRNKITNNGERLARVEATLSGTGERLGRLHIQVTKNVDGITDLRIRGTPDPPDR